MNYKLLLFFFFYEIIFIHAKLEPTKLEDNGVYRLEIQSEDKWLTGIENDLPIRSSWKGSQQQKWIFRKSADLWQITPVSGAGGLSTMWKIRYVGHGKFQFINPANGMCLRGPGCCSVREDRCEVHDHDPGQRWLILPA